jgi:hypothetical protein
MLVVAGCAARYGRHAAGLAVRIRVDWAVGSLSRKIVRRLSRQGGGQIDPSNRSTRWPLTWIPARGGGARANSAARRIPREPCLCRYLYVSGLDQKWVKWQCRPLENFSKYPEAGA